MLGIPVPMTVYMVDTRFVALVLEDLELIDVAIARNQRPLGRSFRERFGLIDEGALGFGSNRDLAQAPALGPGGFQDEPVTAVRSLGLELDALLASQSERCLQAQRQLGTRVGDGGDLPFG